MNLGLLITMSFDTMLEYKIFQKFKIVGLGSTIVFTSQQFLVSLHPLA